MVVPVLLLVVTVLLVVEIEGKVVGVVGFVGKVEPDVGTFVTIVPPVDSTRVVSVVTVT